jgi:pyruvate dehydrogenase E2 component (dihydrolipoamide acetyltransferase)
LGEGLTEAFIEAVLVAPGDRVEQFAAVFEVQTEKAVVEVTSPWSGVIDKVVVEEGTWVEVGAPLLVMVVDS